LQLFTLNSHDAFIVTFDTVNKQAIARIHQPEVQAMKLAVAFESETPSRFSSLSEGIYLTNSAGKIVYSTTFTMSADLRVDAYSEEDRRKEAEEWKQHRQEALKQDAPTDS